MSKYNVWFTANKGLSSFIPILAKNKDEARKKGKIELKKFLYGYNPIIQSVESINKKRL